MSIDITFNFYSDSNGGDPDLKSPTLRKYHKILWSKPLPNGDILNLDTFPASQYLTFQSNNFTFSLGSDAIVHSYKNQARKQWLIQQMPSEVVDELRNLGSTIGGYIIFPNKKINDMFTINQARGVNKYIDDRFDLTLECIRLFYLGQPSPLYDTFLRYNHFFELFKSFEGYIDFFLLNDIVDSNYKVKFYLPYNGFNSPPVISNVDEYLTYKNHVMNFVNERNQRIKVLAYESIN
jgi:hypothetical protein